jgi:hypothetical protein
MGSALSNAEVRRHLAALFGDAPDGSLVEMRCRSTRGMRQTFHDAGDLDRIAAAISRRAGDTDVYVGVLPRARPGGTRDDLVGTGNVLWADCDSRDAVRSLASFQPQPSMTVASGSDDRRHAYWFLTEPISLDAVESANRNVATVLGADLSCADAPRILRPPSLNHKHQPPRPVRLLACEPRRRYQREDIVGADQPPLDAAPRPSVRADDDELLLVDPAVYVATLTGLTVPRERKVSCPFHDDDTPSLHVYPDPARGWYCYGCRRGGSVYDLAAGVWGMGTRGDDFRALREALCLLFDHRSLA